MIQYRKTYEKGKYDFLDEKCIGRSCFNPGEYFTRGACGGGGSRATGRSTFCCLRRAYHGCPHPIEEFDAVKAKKNKEEGWKKV